MSGEDGPNTVTLAAEVTSLRRRCLELEALAARAGAAEEALRQGESRYRELVESQGEGIGIVDEGERFVFANPAAARIFGVPEGALVGRALREFTTEEAYAVVLAQTSRRRAGEKNAYEMDITRPDGVTRHILVTATPRHQGETGYAGALGIFRDITAWHLAEQQLKESRQMLRAVLDAIPVRVFWQDGDGVYLGCNRAFAEDAGLASPDDVVGLRSRDLPVALPPGACPPEYGVAPAPGPSRPRGADVDAVSGPGAVHVRASTVPLHHADGRIRGVLGIYEDISDLRRAEEERRRLEAKVLQTQKLESLGVMAGGIAHDFNNLLQAMLGNLEMALQTLPPSLPSRECVLEADQAGRRAADLVRQLLAYSGHGQLVVQPLDVEVLVREMAHLLELSISKRATLRWDLAPGLPAVEADPTQLRQVIMNLLINASEALQERPGTISLCASQRHCDRAYLAGAWAHDDLAEGIYVAIDVTDTGCGMDDATLQRVFDPFFTTKSAGRGLGLAAVLGIVRGHRGAIRVHSAPGHGTTFQVLLPAAPQPAVSHPATLPTPPARFSNGVVLIADDEEMVRQVAARMVELVGFKALLASNGAEALEVFRAHRDDITCVLLDLTMPELDGPETFLQIRRLSPGARVLLSSGHSPAEVAQRYGGMGFAGFVAKPYQLHSLVEALRAALGPEGPSLVTE
jgi:PAS domain S-box-containing protein